jgi:hypothetical protein
VTRKYFRIPEYEGSLSKRITSIVPNPKRQRSKARVRFSFYRDQMTVADYVLKCGTVSESHLALFDITYDLDHGFIKLAD